jgi:hypothetical protein
MSAGEKLLGRSECRSPRQPERLVDRMPGCEHFRSGGVYLVARIIFLHKLELHLYQTYYWLY